MSVQPFHERQAELWILNKRRPLTPDEMMEMQHCLAANAKYCLEYAYLKNLSLVASMTEDWAWQHEVCAKIDELECTGGTKKKPGSRKRNTGDKK